jgi:hypothetical protein
MTATGKFRTAMLALAVVGGASAIGVADSPWTRLMAPNRVEADPNRDYVLQENNGPWMIMACSFSGDGAEEQAKQLVLELRARYKMEAYVHKAKFKLDDPNGPNPAAADNPVRWQYRRFHDQPDLYRDGAIKEIGVLVGNYTAIDDPEAQKALKQIKTIDPDCLNLDKTKSTSRTLAAWRSLQQVVREKIMPNSDEAKQKKGPMAHAFATTNPLLPADYYAPKGGLDEFVLRLNQGVPHGLLNCPRKYTVQVATFTGSIVLDQREIEKIQNGEKDFKSRLERAAEMAHELTEALRIKGYESYEFHDRSASIVTVGSFDSVGTPRQDGKIEINPKILAIMKTFGGATASQTPASNGRIAVKSLAGIPFDYQPIPVEVPKRSISRELARRLDTAAN